jgi:hypothetical protein
MIIETDNVTKLPVRLKDNTKLVAVANPYEGCQHRRAIVDSKLAELTCADCNAKMNPIQFLVGLATQERLYEQQQQGIAAARAELNERKRCRCTKCGEVTEIRRVGKREIERLRSTSKPQGKEP